MADTSTIRKGTRVTGEDRSKLATDLKARYDAGESIRSLATATGRSYGLHPPHPHRDRGGAPRPGRCHQEVAQAAGTASSPPENNDGAYHPGTMIG